MTDPIQAAQLGYQLSRLTSLHAAASARASSPPRLPDGAWLGPASSSYEILAEQFASTLVAAAELLRDARTAAAREFARVIS